VEPVGLEWRTMARFDGMTATLLMVLADLVGVLGWAVVPGKRARCFYAATTQDDQGRPVFGREKVPCSANLRHILTGSP
jgi:hypothetical protein